MGESFNAWMGNVKENSAMFANELKNVVQNYNLNHENVIMIEMCFRHFYKIF